MRANVACKRAGTKPNVSIKQPVLCIFVFLRVNAGCTHSTFKNKPTHFYPSCCLVACCESCSYQLQGDAHSSASCSNASSQVYHCSSSLSHWQRSETHSLHHRRLQRRLTISIWEKKKKLVKHPLKWNMELRFAMKVAKAWVTFVNTHLPCGVLSLKLLPGCVVLGAEVKTRRLKSSATITLIRCWLTHCWLVVFQTIGKPLNPLCERMCVRLNAYEGSGKRENCMGEKHQCDFKITVIWNRRIFK